MSCFSCAAIWSFDTQSVLVLFLPKMGLRKSRYLKFRRASTEWCCILLFLCTLACSHLSCQPVSQHRRTNCSSHSRAPFLCPLFGIFGFSLVDLSLNWPKQAGKKIKKSFYNRGCISMCSQPQLALVDAVTRHWRSKLASCHGMCIISRKRLYSRRLKAHIRTEYLRWNYVDGCSACSVFCCSFCSLSTRVPAFVLALQQRYLCRCNLVGWGISPKTIYDGILLCEWARQTVSNMQRLQKRIDTISMSE